MKKEVKYHLVTVAEKYDDDNGKIKSRNAQYLVESISTFDADQIVRNLYKGCMNDWKISSNRESKIDDVLLLPVK